MHKLQNDIEPYLNPKNSPIWPKKARNGPKIGQKLKSRIKTFLRKQKLLVYKHKLQNCIEPYLDPINSPIGPKKAQNDPKIA